jgi:septation ring formation regulator EzrA
MIDPRFQDLLQAVEHLVRGSVNLTDNLFSIAAKEISELKKENERLKKENAGLSDKYTLMESNFYYAKQYNEQQEETIAILLAGDY